MNWAHVMVFSGLGVFALLAPAMIGYIIFLGIAYAYFTWHKDRKPR